MYYTRGVILGRKMALYSITFTFILLNNQKLLLLEKSLEV
jgi:hypothetical protein